MSFVALKNIFFGRPSGASSTKLDHSWAPLQRQNRGSSTRTVIGPDLESQRCTYGTMPTRQEAEACPPKSRSLKVDARVISDATIGLSDGLTVPFALTAGLSALGNTRVVIFGGLAELIAGAISMGLGGYLGAKSELASYRETRFQISSLISADPTAVEASVRTVFAPFGIPSQVIEALTKHLAASEPEHIVDFITKFEHCAEEPSASRALTSALTIAMGYFLGGLVPLIPYLFVADLMMGLYISIAVMAVALFSFGYVKTCIVAGWNGSRCVKKGMFGGFQMVVVGGAAAGAAMGLVKAFDGMAGS